MISDHSAQAGLAVTDTAPAGDLRQHRQEPGIPRHSQVSFNTSRSIVGVCAFVLALSRGDQHTPDTPDYEIHQDIPVADSPDLESPAADTDDVWVGLALEPPSDPIVIDGSDLSWGEARTASLLLTNTSNADVVLLGVELRYSAISPTVEGVDGAALSLVGGQESDDVVSPGNSKELRIRYLKLDDLARSAELVVTVAGLPSRELVVGVLARPGGSPAGAEVEIAPPELDFGFVVPGQDRTMQAEIHVTGSPAHIRWAVFEPDPDGLFTVEISASIDRSPELPAIVREGTPGIVRVRYSPNEGEDVGSGSPPPDEAELVLALNTSAGFMRLLVRGTATSTCPVAVIALDDEKQMYPLVIGQPVYLLGSFSFSPVSDAGVEIRSWHWGVGDEPEGSSVALEPSERFPHVRFTPEVPGKYEVGLEVEDSRGVLSCNAAKQVIHVGPERR